MHTLVHNFVKFMDFLNSVTVYEVRCLPILTQGVVAVFIVRGRWCGEASRLKRRFVAQRKLFGQE